MTVRTPRPGDHVLDCDLCPASLEGEDLALVFDTPEEAIMEGREEGWTRLPNGRHACTRHTGEGLR
ncbi:hypothetical protein AB0C77_12735 [Streptomyces sp. NPDC048629]|uniref:hypothetical protein n=1 Tax=Streptomyces sp. NPDC048629 TaxID=3154824 RepID=UPI003421CBA4